MARKHDVQRDPVGSVLGSQMVVDLRRPAPGLVAILIYAVIVVGKLTVNCLNTHGGAT